MKVAYLLSILAVAFSAPVPEDLNRAQRVLQGGFEAVSGVVDSAGKAAVHPIGSASKAVKATGQFIRQPIKSTGNVLKKSADVVKKEWKEDPWRAGGKLAAAFAVASTVNKLAN